MVRARVFGAETLFLLARDFGRLHKGRTYARFDDLGVGRDYNRFERAAELKRGLFDLLNGRGNSNRR